MKIRNGFRWFKNSFSRKISFENLRQQEKIYLYAGDIPQNGYYDNYVGLSLNQSNSTHIKHDVTEPIPFDESTVDLFQVEDVFEHIALAKLPSTINEIFRILKPDGLFRLSLPDYRCDFIRERTLKDANGKFIFDPNGGGKLSKEGIIEGGHLWFPTFEIVRDLLQQTYFEKIEFLHYYDETGVGVTKQIDYTLGHVMRTPDHDSRVSEPFRPLSIVVDCTK